MTLSNFSFHFVGVGGIGMCGLAEILLRLGARVSGSDLSKNAQTLRLEELGATVHSGHKEEYVCKADVLVYSSAVPQNNPEVLEARRRKIPVITRAEALAEIMRLKRGLAIAGTHGKTTTTSLASSIFLEAQWDPSIVVGGRFARIQSTAKLGVGEWLIAEADESDGSFQKLSPEISVITNIDNDHLDHYKSFDSLERAFFEFGQKIPFYGCLIVCGDDPILTKLFLGFSKRVLFYGFEDHNDFILKGGSGKYSVSNKLGESIFSFELQFPGRHNGLNALGAALAANQAGIPWSVSSQGLAKFQGVDRRFQLKGEINGIKIYDDYGHHPTEVRATLQAFREKYPTSRLVVYFQPHRYSRTESCWQDFTTCFQEADILFLGDIYGAGETPRPGVGSDLLFKDIKLTQTAERDTPSKKVYLRRDTPLQKQCTEVLETLRTGDIFITLGAGDGWKLGQELINLLRRTAR